MKTSIDQDIQVIFWDFDGVLMDSNQIRDKGFAEVLKSFPEEQVEDLLHFHRHNGGLSRYVKFRYFFEEIRNETISVEDVNGFSAKFSKLMRKLLIDPNFIIGETLAFVQANYDVLPMHIVSGSDQEELRYLCTQLNIASYFQRIHGSPTPKKRWVDRIITEEKYLRTQCLLIGDSINDWEAAMENGIHFMGYNNEELFEKSTISIDLRKDL